MTTHRPVRSWSPTPTECPLVFGAIASRDDFAGVVCCLVGAVNGRLLAAKHDHTGLVDRFER